MRKVYSVILMVCFLLSLVLCGCKEAPKEDVVISKNNPDQEEIFMEENEETLNTDSISVSRNDTFKSTDGSVEFTWDVDFQAENLTFPVIETSPYFIQGSDAQRITSVLFGDAVFYGVAPETKHQYSKSELQKKIQILSPYANEESLVELMGDEANLEQLQIRLNQYNTQLESAPDENPHAICDWELHKDNYYWDGLHSSQAYGMDTLIATAQIDGRDYMVSLMNHDGDDYQDSSIEVRIGDGMPDTYLENRLQRIELCRTEKPTQEQVNRAVEKTMNYVNQMELGEYQLSEVYVSKEVQDDDLYSIVVDAVPAYEGSRVIRGASNQRIIPMDNYDSEYAMTKVRFEFNANAELLYFSMVGLTKEEAVINNNTKPLPIDDVIAKAQNHLSLYDAEAMDIFTADAMFLEFTTGRSRDSLDCKVTITGMDYGLGRIQKADSDNLYYVPAVMLEGTIDWYDKASGELVTGTGLSNRGGKRVRTLVMINAVDGSII